MKRKKRTKTDRRWMLIVAVIVLGLCSMMAPKEEEPSRLTIDPQLLQTGGAFLQELGREVENAAHVENLDEHIIQRMEYIFDNYSRNSDFPAGFITRPVARLAIRPVVNTTIRWVTDNANIKENDHATDRF